MDESARRGWAGGMGVNLAGPDRNPTPNCHNRIFERSSREVIASAGPGSGGTSTLRLPLHGAVPAGSTAVDAQARAGAGAAVALPRRVLLVDDNRDARASLAELLCMIGHLVMVAADGPESLSMMDAGQTFDVALLDIGLPGMSGHELAQLLRQRFAHPTLRLVALTGYALAPGSAHDNTFDDYFVKPVDIDALLGSICKAGRSAACGTALKGTPSEVVRNQLSPHVGSPA